MLTKIEVSQFKCIGESPVTINLTPLTILVGPNGGGKSSLLEALALLKQTDSVASDRSMQGWVSEDTWLSGPMEQFFHCRNKSVPIKLALEADVPAEAMKSALAELVSLPIDSPARLVQWLKANIQHNSHKLRYTIECNNDISSLIQTIWLNGQQILNVQRSGVEAFLTKQTLQSEKAYQIGLSSLRIVDGEQGSGAVREPNPMIRFVNRLIRICASKLLGSICYLSAERGGDWLEVRGNASGAGNFLGRHGEFTIHHLANAFGPSGTREAQKRIEHWAKEFRMTDAVAGWQLSGGIAFSFNDPETKIKLDQRGAGFGSRQLLSVITLLFVAPRGSLLMIEEPEISLHPEGQVKVAEMLADAVAFGNQIVVTTHSKLLLLALRKVVAQKQIRSDQISVYEVSRPSTNAGQTTEARQVPVSEKGILSGWVPSYSTVEDDLWKDWLDETSTVDECKDQQ